MLYITSPRIECCVAAQYLGAKNIDRGRATDKLYLNYLGGGRNWKQGQVMSTYEATLTP